MFTRPLVIALTLATSLIGCTDQRASGPSEAQSAAVKQPDHAVDSAPAGSAAAKSHGGKSSEDHSLYRLDFTITTTEPGKPANSTTHTMNVEENMPGMINVGQNMPLQVVGADGGASMAAPRVDVGLRIKCNYNTVKEGLVLDVDVESSSVDESGTGPRGIRKLVTKGNALVVPGKPTLVASTEEPNSHRKLEVNVTATKLR